MQTWANSPLSEPPMTEKWRLPSEAVDSTVSRRPCRQWGCALEVEPSGRAFSILRAQVASIAAPGSRASPPSAAPESSFGCVAAFTKIRTWTDDAPASKTFQNSGLIYLRFLSHLTGIFSSTATGNNSPPPPHLRIWAITISYAFNFLMFLAFCVIIFYLCATTYLKKHTNLTTLNIIAHFSFILSQKPTN